MNYLTNIEKNKIILNKSGVWSEIEKLIDKKHLTFEESLRFGQLYRSTIEDLSLCQTRLPESDVCSYLNTLVIKANLKMHREKKIPLSGLFTFIFIRLPDAIKYSCKEFIFSIIIFMITITICFFMITSKPEYAEIFLPGDFYTNAMIDLEKMETFKNFDNIPEEQRGNMSLYIWFNNVKVSIIAFTLGITIGIGTLFMLIFNGMLLGGLGTVYYLNGHFIDFFSIVMLHGSIELTAIFLATGAGFSIGNALLFPGRYRRRDKLKVAIKNGFTVLIGVVILLLAAALFEGLVTTQKPDINMRFLLLGVNAGVLFFYITWAVLKKSGSYLD